MTATAYPLDILQSSFNSDGAQLNFLFIIQGRPAVPKILGYPSEEQTLLRARKIQISSVLVDVIVGLTSR